MKCPSTHLRTIPKNDFHGRKNARQSAGRFCLPWLPCYFFAVFLAAVFFTDFFAVDFFAAAFFAGAFFAAAFFAGAFFTAFFVAFLTAK